MTVLNIFRYKPAQKAKYTQYDVQAKTVLEGLEKIKAEQDPTLSFRHNCKSGRCGSCAMTIDGKQVLACQTKLQGEQMRVEPLKSFPVKRDLIVDNKRFWQHYESIKPWIIKDPKKNIPLTNQELEHATRAAACIQCGACSSSCSVTAKEHSFFGPAAATTLYRFVADPRDTRQKERCKLATDNGLWSCVKSFDCIDACPVGLNPAEMIRQIRQVAIEHNIKHPAAKQAKTLMQTILTHGEPNEMKVYLATRSSIFSKNLPVLLDLAKKKRLPPKEVEPNAAAKDLQKFARRTH